VASTGGFWWVSGREVRAARRRIPEILQLAERYDFDGFYRAARGVVPLLPDDPQLKQAWINMTSVATVDSSPTGAEVWIKGYSATSADWIPIGQTPFEQVRVPFGQVRLKVSKNGYAPVEAALNPFSGAYALDPINSVPDGMVRVPSDVATVEGTTLTLPTFWMDRFEITNRQFKTFVEAGGYRRRELWKEPFVENGRAMAWDQAMGRLVDKTGRPGPSTWELGSYLDGQADLPVSGVSWYEAAAYGVFMGKSLPTAYQWRSAGGFTGASSMFRDILTLSNFDMKGPTAVGSHAGLAPWGTYDMAGNVKEWCWNESSGGRMILGGGWNEATYMFDDRDAQPSFQRLAPYGFRLVKNIDPQPAASYDAVGPGATTPAKRL
jgi:hypothetical protein